MLQEAIRMMLNEYFVRLSLSPGQRMSKDSKVIFYACVYALALQLHINTNHLALELVALSRKM